MCRFDKVWIRVKFLKSTSSTWFTTTDNLKGMNYIYTTNEESFSFDGTDYTEFLFLREMNSNAGHKWLIAPKLSVIPATASATASSSVSKSNLSATSQTFTWDLSDTAKAPYIGIQDTTSGSTMGSSMFHIESSAPSSDSSAFQDGNTSVWINAG
jgi:hypothetical protein